MLGSPDFGVYQVHARAVSSLLEKDATGTPEVPVPVLHFLLTVVHRTGSMGFRSDWDFAQLEVAKNLTC